MNLGDEEEGVKCTENITGLFDSIHKRMTERREYGKGKPPRSSKMV